MRVASAAVRSEAVVLLLMKYLVPIVRKDFVLCPCFVMWYLVWFIVVQSSRRGRESLLFALLELSSC